MTELIRRMPGAMYIKPATTIAQAAALWGSLESDLFFEPEGQLIRLSGPPEILDPFVRLLRTTQVVSGRFLHLRATPQTTRRIVRDCQKILVGVDLNHIFASSAIVEEGDQGDIFLQTLASVRDIDV